MKKKSKMQSTGISRNNILKEFVWSMFPLTSLKSEQRFKESDSLRGIQIWGSSHSSKSEPCIHGRCAFGTEQSLLFFRPQVTRCDWRSFNMQEPSLLLCWNHRMVGNRLNLDWSGAGCLGDNYLTHFARRQWRNSSNTVSKQRNCWIRLRRRHHILSSGIKLRRSGICFSYLFACLIVCSTLLLYVSTSL